MPCTYTYDLITGEISGRVNSLIPESQSPNDGQGFIRTEEDPQFGNIVDITQTPPVLITDHSA